MTKARSAEIHPHLRRADQAHPTYLIRQEAHHQILQQSLRVLKLNVRPVRGVGCLLEEYGVPRDLANVDWDTEALGGKDAVHEGDILGRQIAADGEDQDTRLEGWGAGVLDAVVSARVRGADASWGRGCGGEEEGLLVYVCEG